MTGQDISAAAGRPGRERKNERRAFAILDAAGRLFAAKGYLKSTMDEIALAADMTKPTLYRYFPTKDALLFALLQGVNDRIGEALRNVRKRLMSGDIQNGPELIAGIFEACYRGYEPSPIVFCLFPLSRRRDLSGPDTNEASEAGWMDIVDAISSLLALGAKKGLLKDVNADLAAGAILGGLVGMMQFTDTKADRPKGSLLNEGALALAERLFADALASREMGFDPVGQAARRVRKNAAAVQRNACVSLQQIYFPQRAANGGWLRHPAGMVKYFNHSGRA